MDGAGNVDLVDLIAKHGALSDIEKRRDDAFLAIVDEFGRWRDKAEEIAHQAGVPRDKVFRAMDAAATLARHNEPAEVVKRFREILEQDGAKTLTVRALGEIEPEPIDWLCERWFARGHLHLVAGPPGLGKSTIVGDIVARVSTGTDWADGTPMFKGRAIIWSGEESEGQTLAPRLLASGADPRMVSVIGQVTDGADAMDFSPAQHLPLLEQKIIAMGDVALLVVDPILRVVEGAKDTYNPSAVREKLAPLVALAHEHRVAVIGVTHFNKLQSAPASGRADRVLGSGAWVQVARVVYGVDWMDEEEADGKRKRAMMPLKSNLALLGNGLSFRTSEVVLPDRAVSGVHVEWTGAVEGDADDVFIKPGYTNRGRPATESDDAADWLLQALASGPMKWTALVEKGQQEGHAERTLRRARDVLKADGSIVKKKGHEWALTN